MIIVFDRVGLIGNQIWAYANIIALGKECKTRVVICLTRPYYEMFDRDLIMKNKDVKVTLLVDNTFTARLVIWLRRFMTYRIKRKGIIRALFKNLPVSIIEEFMSEDEFKSKFKRKRIYFINSWEQRYNKNFFIKGSAVIRNLFLPEASIKNSVDDQFTILRKTYNLIVGVHLRRAEDYQTWLGGKYLFDDQVYKEYLNQIQGIFKQEKILFYLFSDKPVNTDNYSEYEFHYQKNSSVIADLYAMSLCNYLIGVVSTFSMWASFWNKVPLYHIQNKNEKIRLEDFSPIIAQDMFLNNRTENKLTGN